VHSRIFQISTSPVAQADYIKTSDFIDHWFVGSVADYVSSDNDRDEDIQDLRSCFEKRKAAQFNTNGPIVSFIILPGGKEAYFAKPYEEFTAAIDEIMELGLREFACGEFDSLVWKMQESYCSKYNFYLSIDDEVVPLAKFIRDAVIGTRYYIGGTLDYHC